MKYLKLTTVLLLIVVLGSPRLLGQLLPTLGGQRAGISPAQFLKIGVGARAAGMGESFVSISNDASALYWNPAGLVQFGENEVVFSHTEWVADIKHEFFGAVYHLTQNDGLGISITSLHMDDMPVTTETRPLGTGEYFRFGDFALGLTYSRRMTDQFSFGGTVKYVEETLANLKMRSVMVDLGTYYWTGLGTSRFAVVLSNFGGQLTPSGEVEYQSFSPPTLFKVGFAFEPIMTDEHRLTTSLQLNHPNDNSENVGIGLEYAWTNSDLNITFLLRSGYKINVDEQSLSFGAGLLVPLGFSRLAFDYAYVKFERLGLTHRISLSARI
jgi:hypothetical protein